MLLPRRFLIIAASAFVWAGGTAQGLVAPPDPPVDYLVQTPVIDGKLDQGLRRLPVRRFASFTFSDRESVPSGCTYRLGYTASGLYFQC